MLTPPLHSLSGGCWVLFAIVFFAAGALAAPDEAALGKAEGYPVCPPSLRPEMRCLIGLVSRFDEVFPARKVSRGTKSRPLQRAATEPAFRYTYESQDRGLDDYLVRNRTTGLLILKGDTILAERYQYDRTPQHRMNSYSMAKTQILGLVLRAATATPLAEYLSAKIWQPMGAEADASWAIDKGGYEAAYFAVNATVRDYARLGMLLPNDGALDGRKIIPSGWVRAATTPAAKQFEPGHTNSFFGYGYQTWIVPGQERQFVLRGLRGQCVFVHPKSKLVLVHTAARDVGDPGRELTALWFGVVKNLAQ